MEKAVYKTDEGYSLVASGQATNGGILVGLVRGGAFELLVGLDQVDKASLVKLLEEEGVVIPEALRGEKTDFEDLKESFFEAVRTAKEVAHREYQNHASPKAKETVDKVGGVVKAGTAKVGQVVDKNVKPALASSSDKFVMSAMTKRRRDLLSLKARLIEEALAVRLEPMTVQERKGFLERYEDRVAEIADTPEGANLTSWRKVVQRLSR